MFEFLLDEKIDKMSVITAAHAVMRILRHRPGAPEASTAGKTQSFNSAHLDERLAWKIIKEIRKDSKRPITVLTEDEATAYTHDLGAAVDRRIREAPGYDAARGHRLLQELTQET